LSEALQRVHVIVTRPPERTSLTPVYHPPLIVPPTSRGYVSCIRRHIDSSSSFVFYFGKYDLIFLIAVRSVARLLVTSTCEVSFWFF